MLLFVKILRRCVQIVPAQRRQCIMDELYAQQVVTVQALAEKLQVAPMTIRRDLHLLEQQGLIKKSHGGAVLVESSVQEAAYHNRQQAHRKEKQQIAAAALAEIDDAMCLYLDAGTTNYELAVLISRKRWSSLTVVTNDLAIAQTLTPAQGITVILLGGKIDASSCAVCGPLAAQMAGQFHFDICFLGTQAVTPDWHIMTANAEKISIKKICMNDSDKVILLADHSKFRKHKIYTIASIFDMSAIISDYLPTRQEQDLLQKNSVTFYHV